MSTVLRLVVKYIFIMHVVTLTMKSLSLRDMRMTAPDHFFNQQPRVWWMPAWWEANVGDIRYWYNVISPPCAADFM